MSYLRRVKSIEKFCMELQDAAQQTLKPYLSQTLYTSKSSSKRYLKDTFNSTLRKQPPIIKQQHRVSCKAVFCQQMQKLLDRGIWIQNRYRKKHKNVNNQEDRPMRRYQTPTFSSFQIFKQQKSSNRKQFEQDLNRQKQTKNRYTEQQDSVRKTDNSSRIVQHYEQRIRALETHNRISQEQLKSKLRKVENQNENLKRSIGNNRRYPTEIQKQHELKKKSCMRQKRIRDLLKQIGVPLTEKQYSYSKTGVGSTGYQ